MTDVLRTVADLRDRVGHWKAAGDGVGVVPTMGALHDGHLSLVRAAQRECRRVIVTIFVNPAQFDDPADLDRYPRTEAADVALLEPLGVDVVFGPLQSEVYPTGFASNVRVGGIAKRLEGLHRPGHFDGVATVVAKLFGMTQADRAYFGEKDWQQLQVVRQMARDLDMTVKVVGCPTIREADGLARSSRNARLSPDARATAAILPRVMADVVVRLRTGAEVTETLAWGRRALTDAGVERVEYLDVCDGETLLWLDRLDGPARLLAAVRVGGVRLIDNIAV